jgi:hypothetical protein
VDVIACHIAWMHSFNSLPDALSETSCFIFIFTSSAEAARVMKDETRVAPEHQFILMSW